MLLVYLANNVIIMCCNNGTVFAKLWKGIGRVTELLQKDVSRATEGCQQSLALLAALRKT